MQQINEKQVIVALSYLDNYIPYHYLAPLTIQSPTIYDPNNERTRLLIPPIN